MRVDFPIPGSPPNKTEPSLIIPPPKTRSNSSIPLEKRKSSPIVTSDKTTGWLLLASLTNCFLTPLLCFWITSSLKEFQEPQSGQRPSHFDSTRPHSVHTYWRVTFFIIVKSQLIQHRIPGMSREE